jgi:hypothetical protein
MRDNLIFRFDPSVNDFKECKSENCVALVRAFLRNILGITEDIYIQTAHRLGKASPANQRAMIARIPQSEQRTLIFRNANRLRDTHHYISQQLPPSCSERKQFTLPDYTQLKSDVRNTAVLTQDTLFVKNKLQTQYMKPQLPERPLAHEAPCVFTEGKEKKEAGSVFRGYCANVTDIKEVSDIRQYLIYNKPDVSKATHVIYAYRLEQRGKIHENFDSDRDWGTGHELLKMMRLNNIVNAVCIATRLCNPGFSHIGKRRFMHVNDSCLQAYKSLNS